MTIKYKTFDETFTNQYHEKLDYYRKLYQGKHSEIFGRAEKLIKNGEIIDNLLTGNGNNRSPEVAFVQTPYIVANICKLIPEIPAMLISRSLGKFTSSLKVDEQQNAAINTETSEAIDGPNDSTFNGKVVDLQNELIQQIVKNSNLTFEHHSNIVQHQVDGGLVGVPFDDERGIRIEFMARDVYYPHEDGLGADLTFVRKLGLETDEELSEYLYTYRERQEEGGVRTQHILRGYGEGGNINEDLPPEQAAPLLGKKVEDLNDFYAGKVGTFIKYWANEKTFMDPLGVSVLRNQEGRQDEINWRLTRTAAIFERNGKPRLAISKEVARKLQEKMVKTYGKTFEHKFDSRDLEIVSMDDNGRSIEVIQIDVKNIGDITWIKDLIKLMLIETKTSEKAIDFYMDNGNGAAQSGVAKFYDLFLSLMKAEHLQKEYIHFLKELFRDALWLKFQSDDNVKIEEPEVQLLGMLPVQRKELVEENMMALGAGKSAQSLETTIRRNNPTASEDWILDELERIEAEAASTDSTSIAAGARQTLSNFLDNPDERPTPNATGEGAATPEEGEDV